MGCSSRRGARGLWALVVLALAAPGCASGWLVAQGRLRESVLAYEAGHLDGDVLRVRYRTQVASARGEPRAAGLRAVAVPVEALRAQPPLPVDAFPVRRLPADAAGAAGRPLPLRTVAPGAEPAPAVPGEPELRVVVRDGRHAELWLCGVPAGADEACPGRLPSEALYRDRTAWWAYAGLPLGVALDVAALPFQLVGSLPFVLFGD